MKKRVLLVFWCIFSIGCALNGQLNQRDSRLSQRSSIFDATLPAYITAAQQQSPPIILTQQNILYNQLDYTSNSFLSVTYQKEKEALSTVCAFVWVLMFYLLVIHRAIN